MPDLPIPFYIGPLYVITGLIVAQMMLRKARMKPRTRRLWLLCVVALGLLSVAPLFPMQFQSLLLGKSPQPGNCAQPPIFGSCRNKSTSQTEELGQTGREAQGGDNRRVGQSPPPPSSGVRRAHPGKSERLESVGCTLPGSR
jgi:hypothetical protein